MYVIFDEKPNKPVKSQGTLTVPKPEPRWVFWTMAIISLSTLFYFTYIGGKALNTEYGKAPTTQGIPPKP